MASRAPHAAFFCTAITAPRASIQPGFAMPTTSNTAINPAQQPRHDRPYATPMRTAWRRTSARPVQPRARKPNGDRHARRHRSASGDSW